jgi:type II secretory pathway pseudopilin PulG
MKRRVSNRAFTLVELLLALARVGVLAVSLFSSLRMAFDSRGSSAQALAPARSVAIAMELIRQDLQSAMSPTGILAGAFIGERASEADRQADRVEFYAISSTGELGDIACEGIHKIELAVAVPSDGTEAALVRRSTGNLLAPVVPDAQEEVLCRGIRSLRIQYFDGSTWQDSWDSTQQGDILPSAVMVSLEVEARSGGSSVELPPYRMAQIFRLSCYRDPEATEARP